MRIRGLSSLNYGSGSVRLEDGTASMGSCISRPRGAGGAARLAAPTLWAVAGQHGPGPLAFRRPLTAFCRGSTFRAGAGRKTRLMCVPVLADKRGLDDPTCRGGFPGADAAKGVPDDGQGKMGKDRGRGPDLCRARLG